MQREVRGVLLDLDETLYSREDAFWSWIESEAQAASALEGLDRKKVAELDQRGRGDKQALLAYLDSVFGWRETPQDRQRRFRSGISGTARLAPGVKESLERIASQLKLGLISNGTGATQRQKLKALGVESAFDPILISEEVGFRKPDARIFALAIRDWHTPADSVLFVGDDPVSDIGGARAAGMRTLQVGDADGIPSILSLETWLDENR
jgi:putative hydrolase of the HAD superfamily